MLFQPEGRIDTDAPARAATPPIRRRMLVGSAVVAGAAALMRGASPADRSLGGSLAVGWRSPFSPARASYRTDRRARCLSPRRGVNRGGAAWRFVAAGSGTHPREAVRPACAPPARAGTSPSGGCSRAHGHTSKGRKSCVAADGSLRCVGRAQHVRAAAGAVPNINGFLLPECCLRGPVGLPSPRCDTFPVSSSTGMR